MFRKRTNWGALAKALNNMAQKLKDQHWLAEGKAGNA